MSFAQILDKLDKLEKDKLETKIPSWAGLDIRVPRTVNFQQCSGETAARYKASLVAPGLRVADLTGGLGVDAWAFSLRSQALWYNERDSVLLEAVQHNFAVLGVRNAVFNNFDISPRSQGWTDSLKAFAPDVIYLDPARRDSAGRKVFLLEDCSPDVLQLMPSLLDTAPLVMVKVSPMADITMLRRRLDGFLSGLHVVGAEGECKELLCLCRRESGFGGIVLSEDGRVFSPAVPPAGQLLFVPSAAMVKSGLGPGMCLAGYTEGLRGFGRYYQVVENLPFASSAIRDLGRRCPQADVTARGVPLSSEQLRSKMKTKPGGPVHIFACVLGGERRLLVCEQVLAPEQVVVHPVV